MALMFPIVMLVLNVSSVAALWFGADRIDSGRDAGRLAVAFLSYLIQILMSVMMATFMVVDGPARRGVRRAHPGGARHRLVGRRRRPTPVTRAAGARRRSSSATSGSTTPAPSTRCSADISLHAPRRADHRDRRQHRRGQDHAPQPRPPAVRRHRRRRCSSTASTSATSTPSVLWSRIGLVPQKPYLFSGTVASNLRYGKPDATDDELWEALEVAQAARLRAGHARRPRRAASRRAAPTCRAASASASPSPGRSCASPRSTCSTTRSRRSTSPPTPGCAPRSAPYTADAAVGHRRPAGLDDHRTPTRSSCSRTAQLVGLGTHDELLETCPTYAEIVASQIGAEEAA